MGTMVVGIFPDHETLGRLVNGLKSSGFNVERLRVISSETPADHLAETGVQFIYSGEAEEAAIGQGAGLITSFGVDVPGLSHTGPNLEQLHPAASIEDYFVDLNIPGGRWEDYSKAVDAGRSVAGYNGGKDVDKVRGLFSGAGGNPVEVF